MAGRGSACGRTTTRSRPATPGGGCRCGCRPPPVRGPAGRGWWPGTSARREVRRDPGPGPPTNRERRMNPLSDAAAQAAIGAAARELRLPTVRDQAARLAEIAAREHATHLAYLAEILAAELDDRSARRRARRIAEARFPRLKRLADFSADAVPSLAPGQLAHLA